MRSIRYLAVVIAVIGLVACGGGSSSSTAPTAVAAAPSKAQVTFNVDPNPVMSQYQGAGWYKFKVNMEFYDTAGVAFTINSVRTTITAAVTGTILLDYDYSVAKSLGARGRTVLQFTSNRYYTVTGGGANIKFIANITDAKGNSFQVSNQATVLHRDGPKVELD